MDSKELSMFGSMMTQLDNVIIKLQDISLLSVLVTDVKHYSIDKLNKKIGFLAIIVHELSSIAKNQTETNDDSSTLNHVLSQFVKKMATVGTKLLTIDTMRLDTSKSMEINKKCETNDKLKTSKHKINTRYSKSCKKAKVEEKMLLDVGSQSIVDSQQNTVNSNQERKKEKSESNSIKCFSPTVYDGKNHVHIINLDEQTEVNGEIEFTVFVKSKNKSAEHNKTAGRMPIIIRKEKNTETEKSNKKFKCEECNSMYATRYSLERHAESMHGIQRPEKEKSIQRREKEKTAKTAEQKEVCEICGRKLSNKTALHRHINWHKGVKPFTCVSCGKSFTTKCQLQSHETDHMDVSPHNCHLCSTSLKSAYNLKLHLRRHENKRPHHCSYCPKAFKTFGELKAHERIHLQDFRYMCSVCGKQFLAKCKLDRHFRIHTGSKPFSCDLCNKKFTTKDMLRRHERMHTHVRPYTCIYCDRTFSDKSNSRKHEKLCSSNLLKEMKKEPVKKSSAGSKNEQLGEATLLNSINPLPVTITQTNMLPNSETIDSMLENKDDTQSAQIIQLIENTDDLGNVQPIAEPFFSCKPEGICSEILLENVEHMESHFVTTSSPSDQGTVLLTLMKDIDL